MAKKKFFKPGEAREISEQLVELGLLIKIKRLRGGVLTTFYMCREYATAEEIAESDEASLKRKN